MSPANPYMGDAFLQISLCNTLLDDEGIPTPDYSDVRYVLPINSPVHIRKSVDFSENEIKGKGKKKKKKTSRIELKGFKTAEVDFQLQLNSDDDYQQSPQTSIEKFAVLANAFHELDALDRNKVYGVTYPLINEAGIDLVIISDIEVAETAGTDFLLMSVTLKEIQPGQLQTAGSGNSRTSEDSTLANDTWARYQASLDEVGAEAILETLGLFLTPEQERFRQEAGMADMDFGADILW